MLPLFVTIIISVACALYTWRRRALPEALTFVLLMLALAEWSLGYVMELGSSQLSAKIFWGKVQYLGIIFTPVAWFVFALYFTNRESWLSRRNLALLAIIPAITLSLIWTTELHGLMWSRIRLNTVSSLPVLDLRYGAWFWVHLTFSYIMLLLGSISLFDTLRRSPGLYRWQTMPLLFAVVAPWLGNGIYILRLAPIPNLDLTPFAFTLSGVIFGWDLLHFRLFDLIPVARRVVVDGMSDGVIVLDASNRILDLNPAAQRLLGQDATEAIGKTGTQTLYNWPKLLKHYRDLAEGQTEIALSDEGGRQRVFDMRVSPLHGQQGRLTGRIIVLRDITERKQVEQALIKARDQALEGSRLKTELLAKVSHELRTPLNAIQGYAELLEIGAYGPLADEQQQPVGRIIESSVYLAELVNQLLDQAKLDAGQLKLNLGTVVPEELIENMKSKLGVLAETKGLRLMSEIAPNVPDTLFGDGPRLEQILVNLVSNAIKFTDQGEIRVQILCPSTSYWCLQVSDTGAGIPAEARAYVFEPFRQVDGSATRKHGGTGLGLSIVQQLTTLMGGRIILESEVDRGSIFTIILPLQPVQQEVVT
jgi:PAS domain S-box-containing protein